MRLEDALVYLVAGNDIAAREDLPEICRKAISAGADIIGLCVQGLADRSRADEVAGICREESALFVVWDDSKMAMECGAAGVHFSRPDGPVGQTRAEMGFDRLVGLTSMTFDDATLALEVGADYILHMGGRECAGVFAGVRGVSPGLLYAGGIKDLEDARAIIGGGIYRLCLDAGQLGVDGIDGKIAEYSRLLGRTI